MEPDNQYESETKIIGLILTAGFSSRMGAFKPLLPIGDVTAIEMITSTLKAAGVHNIVGVTGFQRELLSSILTRECIVEAYNQDFEKGMFASIKKGIQEALIRWPKAPSGFFLMLVDSPLVPPEVLRLIAEKHLEKPDSFIVPCFRGKKGHPLFIPLCYAEEILAFEGDGGLKAITNRHEEHLIRLEVNEESVVMDMDTPQGYQEIRDYYKEHRKQIEWKAPVKIDDQLRGKRLFFIRHGEIRQHSEKIFLGQTDITLSERGMMQAEKAAAELIRYKVSTNRIYTSDLARASETAEIIRERFNQNRESDTEMVLFREPKLREMSLGEWDGRFISEIKKQFPDEYQKRGENLLTYKFGNSSENFYDLQYRAVKGLQNILKQEENRSDDVKDILIVTHWGVINVLLSYLHHAELGEEVKKPVPNGGIILMDFT